MQTCQYCHTENRDDATYCNHCGGALTAGAPPPADGASGAAGASLRLLRSRTRMPLADYLSNLSCEDGT